MRGAPSGTADALQADCDMIDRRITPTGGRRRLQRAAAAAGAREGSAMPLSMFGREVSRQKLMVEKHAL